MWTLSATHDRKMNTSKYIRAWKVDTNSFEYMINGQVMSSGILRRDSGLILCIEKYVKS